MTRILVCDDDPSICQLLRLALPDLDLRGVSGGRAALEVLQSDASIDALLLDVMMEDLDGLETLRRIRRHAATADLPVVMLTARAADRDYHLAYEAGADGYLTKPFDPADLEALIALVVGLGPADRRRIRSEERARAALLREGRQGAAG